MLIDPLLGSIRVEKNAAVDVDDGRNSALFGPFVNRLR